MFLFELVVPSDSFEVDQSIKIGPTAIPAFWRENYSGMKNFRFSEFCIILFFEAKLFFKNSFQFRSLALEEMKKYMKSHFIPLSLKMVKNLDKNGFGDFAKPGIRAQLLNKETLELLQDFVLKGDHRSIHVLNAVFLGFTCAFPFTRYVVDEMIEKQSQKLKQSKRINFIRRIINEKCTSYGCWRDIGSALVPKLLEKGYRVKAIDRFFFGIKPHENLCIVQEDCRYLKEEDLKDIDTVIYLVAMSKIA